MTPGDPMDGLVLASASPRRAALLRQAGLRFTAIPADVDETVLPGESPETHVRRLACLKAACVSRRAPGAVVLGADTIVVLDGRIFGKPADLAGAHAMLEELSGRAHEVLTGVALCRAAPAWETSWVCRTRVVFRDLQRGEIARYCRLVNPLDKAGAYGIQEHGDILVERLDGSLSNVIGLPVEDVVAALDGVPGAR